MKNKVSKPANELWRHIIKAVRLLCRIILELVKLLCRLTIKIVEALWWLFVGLSQIAYDNFNKRHRVRLRKRENILRLMISIFIFYIFSKALLDTDWRLGLSFIFASLTAIWYGYIYRGRDVMGLVFVGVVIGSLVTVLAPDAWRALSGGDFIGAAAIVGIMIYFYFTSRELKRGRRPRR